MYKNQLAVAIKTAGKVLRENGDTVYLPFGNEYSVYLRNMNTVRAVANVTIDGTDVGGGSGFVVPANGNIEITRFIKNGNLHEGNSFKFIERTGAVENHRGVGVEDGLVRIEFQYEKPKPAYYYDNYSSTTLYSSDILGSNDGMLRKSMSDSYGGELESMNISSKSAPRRNRVPTSAPANETGVTAPGSLNEQQFSVSEDFDLLPEKHVIVLKLLGETEDNQPIVEAITVKHKPRCVSCGHVNRFGAKFCTECGTGLNIL